MRRYALWLQAGLATLIVVAVFVQVYLIASYIFGADSLSAHKSVGFATHGIEILTGLVGIVAWWRTWPMVATSILLPVIGTIQISFADQHGYTGGVHGLLALFILAIAGFLGHRAGKTARGSAPTQAAASA
jgi:hypothetical protein